MRADAASGLSQQSSGQMTLSAAEMTMATQLLSPHVGASALCEEGVCERVWA